MTYSGNVIVFYWVLVLLTCMVYLMSSKMDSQSQYMPINSQDSNVNRTQQSHPDSIPNFASTKRSHHPRKVWTYDEGETLINGLKDLVSCGLKCNNGFRPGYLPAVDTHMNNHFPGTDLKAGPHILSKIHVWRKTYGSLTTMLSRSGLGWNDETCQIVVDSDQVWSQYVVVRTCHL